MRKSSLMGSSFLSLPARYSSVWVRTTASHAGDFANVALPSALRRSWNTLCNFHVPADDKVLIRTTLRACHSLLILLTRTQRFYIANATYTLSTTLLKLSLLCQYLRIFKEGGIRIAIYAIFAFCLVWGVISCVMAWAPCFPVQAYWDWSVTKHTCYAYGAKVEKPFFITYVSHGAFNMVLDLAVLVLPAPIVFRRAMTKRERCAALGLGTLGLL